MMIIEIFTFSVLNALERVNKYVKLFEKLLEKNQNWAKYSDKTGKQE